MMTDVNNPQIKTKPDFKKLPPSSVLQQVKSFLPTIATANNKLQQDMLLDSVGTKHAVNFEYSVSDDDDDDDDGECGSSDDNDDDDRCNTQERGPYVEMNLALGVLEDADTSTSSFSSLPPLSSSSPSPSAGITEETIIIPSMNHQQSSKSKPSIEVISSTNTSND